MRRARAASTCMLPPSPAGAPPPPPRAAPCSGAPRPTFAGPRAGSFNLHASLPPRWRGAAPIQRAIMAGDPETGVMIMRLTAGLDEGPVCLMEREPIGPDDEYGTLAQRLERLGGAL